MTVVIKASKLSFSYEDDKVVDDVSFEVRKQEKLYIVGPNGAGKSTLLKLLVQVYKCGGEIEIHGKKISEYRPRDLAKSIAYVPQAGEISSPFTVRDFVAMGRYPYLSPLSSLNEEDAEAIAEALESTDTKKFENRSLSELSGGERQKVFIASAIAQKADILLLDEPGTFLDPKNRNETDKLLDKLNRENGTTLIVVTHDINRAVLYADHILALRSGKVAYQGASEGFITADNLRKVFDAQFTLVKHPVTGKAQVVPEVIR